ncbi:MAG: PhoX family phosphatase [Pseudomonadota bacterium]
MVKHHDLSFDEFDEIDTDRPKVAEFDVIVERAISRRGFLAGVLTVGASAFLTGIAPMDAKADTFPRFGFKPVDANSADTITLPEGYNWQVVAKWAEPIYDNSGEFDPQSRGTADSQALSFGDNNDGMAVFSKNGRLLLVVNNEYVNRSIIFGNRESGLPETDDDILKGMLGHGVSLVEIVKRDGEWQIVRGSKLNRRITPQDEIEISGPASGNDLLKTAADPTGTKTLGTWNNCGNGRTPWGTYLTCEENFNGYFSSSAETYEPTPDQIRYGLKDKDWGYNWAQIDERFDLAKHPNEPHRAGYVVEIDPFNNSKPARKLTALGRFKHENAEVVLAPNGQVVVYMGDDERGEFIYRFVSKYKFSQQGDNSSLLDDGTLYAARFNEDQSGDWLALTPETTGLSSQAEICIRTRIAASAVGATTMDRPEWVASNPRKAEVYCALTNNKNRGIKPNAGGDETPVGGPNPRPANRYGQVVRWIPQGGDHTSDRFNWDLFVLAGNPGVHGNTDPKAGTRNVTTANMFNSPDGLAFDNYGFLYIQTDGKYSNEGDFEGMGNNQMLIGDTVTGAIERFLVGPKECEVTGLAWSTDRRTMFVGIQHPGERGDSSWPDGGDMPPRSAVIAIERDDGGIIG